MGNKMKALLTVIITIIILTGCQQQTNDNQQSTNKQIDFGLVIHGGAGYIYEGRYTPDEEKAYLDKLEEALKVGYQILNEGGSALDAVEKTIHVMEDSPLFNAGVGAVMTNAETIELDASIMNGIDLNAGTCAGIKRVKSPISLARAIMDSSKHVMLIGEGAEKFADEQGLEKVENKYFFTDKKLKEIQRIKAEERKKIDLSSIPMSEGKFGTVGCAALDKSGNLAAGTSTGGMANKRWGRVGDVPIIGAGTYANNETCALSATGHGEYFIRNVVTHDISARMEHAGQTLQQAADDVVMKKLVAQKGSGGVIGIDKNGNITMTFNSQGMFRGYITDKNKPVVAMYK
jgi:beta-aspartyl-peptidase (threonine type)